MLYKEIDVRGSGDPVAEAVDRVNTHFTAWEAYDRLYGPHTRSGAVTVLRPTDELWGTWRHDWPWATLARLKAEWISRKYGHSVRA